MNYKNNCRNLETSGGLNSLEFCKVVPDLDLLETFYHNCVNLPYLLQTKRVSKTVDIKPLETSFHFWTHLKKISYGFWHDHTKDIILFSAMMGPMFSFFFVCLCLWRAAPFNWCAWVHRLFMCYWRERAWSWDICGRKILQSQPGAFFSEFLSP